MKTFVPSRRVRITAAGVRGGAVMVLAAMVLGGGVTPVRAMMTADQVKRQVETEKDVRVLRVEPVTDEGRKAFKVVIMHEGGDFNSAFQVRTYFIDANTGKPIRQFRHLASGYDTSGPFRRDIP